MTNPIQRAVPALFEAIFGAYEVIPTPVRLAMLAREDRETHYEAVTAVFESIDTDDLAAVILAHYQRSDGLDVTALETAEAVKAHLTGGKQ